LKSVLSLGLGLLAMTLARVATHQLGLEQARFEIPAVLVVYACLSLNTLQAALVSFASGYLFDLASGHPTGLYAFVAMLTFMVARVVVVLVDVRGPVGFAALSAFIGVVHQLLAHGTLLLFTGASGGRVPAAMWSIPPSALLTGLAGLLMYPVLNRIDLAFDREESSVLR
jgi:rod shape-determining protein MreD